MVTKNALTELISALAPRVGFEPTTLRLTAGCSAAELTRNTNFCNCFCILPLDGSFVNYFYAIFRECVRYILGVAAIQCSIKLRISTQLEKNRLL